MLKKISILMFTVVFAGLSQAQCVGSFGLTRKVHGFVTSFGNKWVNWLVFLVFVIIPIYGLAILADAVVVNSVEFWTGAGLARADFDENGEHKRTVSDGDERADIVIRKYGQEMVVNLYKGGDFKKALLLKKDQPGKFFALNSGLDSGETEITLRIEETGSDRHVTVIEGGRAIGTAYVTPRDLAFYNLRAQLLSSVALAR